MQVPVVTASEAAKLLQEQPEQYVLVDVRNREEQQVGAEVRVQGLISYAEGSGIADFSGFAGQMDYCFQIETLSLAAVYM